MIKLPYLKSFSVNGLKYKTIKCTCGGEGEGGLLRHFHLFLNKFVLSANFSGAQRKLERETSSWKYLTDQGLTKLCIIKPQKPVPLQILQIFWKFTPFFWPWKNLQNCFDAVSTRILNKALIFFYFSLSQNKLVWELETWFIAFVPDKHTWEMYTAGSQGSKYRWLSSPKPTYPCTFFTSLFYYKSIISWKLLYVKDFRNKLRPFNQNWLFKPEIWVWTVSRIFSFQTTFQEQTVFGLHRNLFGTIVFCTD